jgi:hypothetical protein
MYDPESVTADWLSQVLAAASEGALVTSTEAETIGTGQVGCNVRYRLTWDRTGPGPASVVVKFASRDEASRAAGIQTQTYETEVAFYRDLAATVDVRRPYCHFAAVEPGTANVVLVLEDIDGVVGDQLAGCPFDQAALAVIEAARLHGPRWGDSTLRDLPWLAAKEASPISPGPVIAMLWPTFVERYGERLSEEAREVGAVLAASATWLDPCPDLAAVCHCDYRLDNMLFAAGHVTVVDWQTVQLGVGTSDISYFLGAAMDREARRKHERDLVGRYHGALSQYDIGDYDSERCWDDYRRHSFGGFFMAVFAAVLVQQTVRGDAMFVAMANGAAAQVVDLGATEFLG